MIFEELVLADVGPFAGEQRIRLAPASSNKPVVLVGGLNGSGKTTILEALLLALYGAQAPGTSRRGASYERHLQQLINRGGDPATGARLELAFRAINDGRWHSFRISRRWWAAGERIRDSLEVLRDGVLDPVLTEAWPDHVEALAPRGVAGLFFFDGEQIEAFADLDAAKELVRTAIGGLLGLDLLDRLQDDLAIIERRNRVDAVTGDDEKQAMHARQAHVENLRRYEADALQKVEQAQRVHTAARHHADRATYRLAAEGGELHDARRQLQRRRDEAETAIRQRRADLVDALGALSPLLLVEPLLANTVAQAVAEQRQADNQIVADLLADRDAQLLELLRDKRAAAKIQSAVEEFLTTDLANRKAGDGIPTVVGTDPQTLTTAQKLLAGDLAAERELLRTRVDALAAAQVALDDADRAIQAIPEEDAVADAIKHHQDATAQLAEAQARLDAAEAEYQDAVNRRRAADERLQRELREAHNTLIQSEEARRLITYAARSRDTVARLRAAATQRHLSRIEALILDSLQTLMRKDNLIREIKIDPETCAVELFTHNGQPVRPRTLSAGERQLLAVSMLAGLARASGRLLPVVIDTPLGRLDRDHRKRLIQRYLPQASHQVIVLSTDTEITPEVIDRLGGSVSHKIKLEHDPSTHTTVARDGYFTAVDTSSAHEERPR
jgi:DNA sulfur modification protein DndD